MGMLEKAKEELRLMRGENSEPDEMQDLIEKDILEIIETFAKQGHSGFSANYCIPIINRLLKQEPLLPLSGKDDEWLDISESCSGKKVYQNKRLPTIFKDEDRSDGQAYNIDGKIFSDDDGKTWYTSKESSVPIEFPYIPKAPERVF